MSNEEPAPATSANLAGDDRRHDTRSPTEHESEAVNPIIDSTGKGLVLFTGPDGLTDYKVNVLEDLMYTGIGSMSTEGTSQLEYLYRAAPGSPAYKPKHLRVGEIGWEVTMLCDKKLLSNGNQITVGEFRQVCEDRYTHRYQNAWYEDSSNSSVSGTSSDKPMNAPEESNHHNDSSSNTDTDNNANNDSSQSR